jgi:hypothetical protein
VNCCAALLRGVGDEHAVEPAAERRGGARPLQERERGDGLVPSWLAASPRP